MENKKELNFLDVIGKITPKTKEDEGFEKTGDLEDKECIYDICNGSGRIKLPEDTRKMVDCQCLIEKRLKQKLKNARLSQQFFNKDFNSYDSETKAHLFKPFKKVVEFKSTTKIKDELNEPVEQFVKRHYDIVEQNRSIQDLLTSYSEKNLKLLNENKNPANLLLFGESGNGKTSFASVIGTYFLQNNKKVYFSTTQDFLDKIFSKTINPKQIAKDYDVLILDELFNEYHTDSQFAKKQLKEILKMREELGKITICTSNGNPKDFSLLYGPSIMSLINGTFFLFMLERETDARIEKMHNKYDDFGL